MNGSILSKVFIFAAGMAVGSIVTLKYLKIKETQYIEENEYEVEGDEKWEDTESDIFDDSDDFKKGMEELKKHQQNVANKIINYAGYSQNEEENKEKNHEEDISYMDAHYVISPEEFGENDYETRSLTLYADGVLVNEYGVIIEEDEIEELIGKESLDTFGEYEDDSVFVRNDAEKTDFEILLDTSKYSDI